MNLPMPQGCDDAIYSRVYTDVVEPIGREFEPELVLVSVGFDPHAADPLAGMQLTAAGFAELTGVCLRIAETACEGRAVLVLEGGYDLEGIAASSAAVVNRLLGERREEAEAAESEVADELIAAYKTHLSPFWRSLA